MNCGTVWRRWNSKETGVRVLSQLTYLIGSVQTNPIQLNWVVKQIGPGLVVF